MKKRNRILLIIFSGIVSILLTLVVTNQFRKTIKTVNRFLFSEKTLRFGQRKYMGPMRLDVTTDATMDKDSMEMEFEEGNISVCVFLIYGEGKGAGKDLPEDQLVQYVSRNLSVLVKYQGNEHKATVVEAECSGYWHDGSGPQGYSVLLSGFGGGFDYYDDVDVEVQIDQQIFGLPSKKYTVTFYF
jgi:hypothetical protein